MPRFVPAEWAQHQAMWVGFPSHGELWLEHLEAAQIEVAALAVALAGPGAERVRLLVNGKAAMAAAKAMIGSAQNIDLVEVPFGDVWLRDTGPIWVKQAGQIRAQGFGFNGWGGKYDLPDDHTVAASLAQASGSCFDTSDFILEGGSLDHDGFGTVLTTRQCLLNPNRNSGINQASAEARLASTLGIKKVLWLEDGLMNDHTDGHIDNLARFVAPGVVACPLGYGRADPNTELYGETARQLSAMTSHDGTGLQVVRIASPGRVEDGDGQPVPASHMNFLIANKAVIVPLYDDADAGAHAVEALASLFPERQVLGLASSALLTGGGSFHCISQQVPA
jgi:agmatine deiminase